MTTTPTEKPLALQLAKNLIQIHQSHADEGDTTFSESAAELERQNAEIARLTAENEALKAKNQPLLIHVIADMADGLTLRRDGRYVIDDYFAFARAIELAHGIVEKP